MGFFSKLFGSKDDAELISDLADEVERYADRFDNSGDIENAALARGYAQRIRQALTLKQAKILHAEFLAIVHKSTATNVHDRDYQRNADTDNYSDDS